MRNLLVAALCAAAVSALAAQDPPAPAQTPPAAAPPAADPQEPIPGPTFRTGVDLIAVDVSVVDRRGRPVEDLRAPEFAVKIDGEERRVVSAELVKVDVEAARKQAADKTETFYTSNITPPNGRQIVLAVDQMNIRPGALRPVLDAAGRFLDLLTPLDQVAFIAYPEPGPRVNFTNDKLRLKLAMQGLVGSQPRLGPMRHNIGLTEAIAIDQRRDQIVHSEVVTRECRTAEPQLRAQCERDVVAESAQIVRQSREDSEQSLAGLRQLLQRLAVLDGPKALILISEGMVVLDETDLRGIVQLAGAARTAINVMAVDLRRGDVTIAEQPPTEMQDRRLHVQGLEALAAMSRGSLFHVAGTGEPIFERLASEISAYYLLGVEQRPSDSLGDRHRIDVEVRRRDVTIRSRQAFVLSPTRVTRRSPEEQLRDALGSPFAVSGLPLRVTTFAQQDPASEKVQLTVAAQVGAPGMASGKFAVGYLVIDDQNRVAGSFGQEVELTSGSGSPNEPLRFVSGVLLDPGLYSLRLAVVDAEGRRGSVIRDISAWKMAGEAFALGDLVLGGVPARGSTVPVQVEPYVSTDSLAAYLELYSNADTWQGTRVTFEIADDQDAPALTTADVTIVPGRQPTWRVASGLVAARMLPPGRYVARAQITRDGKPIGVLARPFVLERADGAVAAAAPAAVAAAAVSYASMLPRFDRTAALEPALLAAMLADVETRSPALKEAMAEARAGRYGPAALEALGSGDQEAAAFLRGLDFFVKGQLDQAATQLQVAAGPRRAFFPAAFYLGACFAAVGRDRDAAGVWQMALVGEGRPPIVYTMAADARLRDGQPGSAIDILQPAYARDPANEEIARRLAMAYAMTGRHAEALPILDAYLARQPTDQDMLLAAIVSQYEAVRAGQALSNLDRARIRQYAVAYRGENQALVEKYLATMEVR